MRLAAMQHGGSAQNAAARTRATGAGSAGCLNHRVRPEQASPIITTASCVRPRLERHLRPEQLSTACRPGR